MFVMKMILPSINPPLSILENLMKYDMVWMAEWIYNRNPIALDQILKLESIRLK